MPEGDFRLVNLANQKAVGAAVKTTTEIDIPASNYLQGLQIRIQNTNGSTSNNAETIESTTDEIEIVADGFTIYKMTGLMARQTQAPDAGHLIAADETQDGSDIQHAYFPIKFGEDDNDQDIIFPAHMVDRITLKITTTYTDSTTAGWTTSSSNAKIDVVARYLMSEDAENSPYLRNFEQSSNTFNTVQVETIKLPVGSAVGAYRRIFVYAREASIQDAVDIDKLDLILNDKTYLYKQVLWTDLQGEDDRRYGVKSEKHFIAFAKDNDTINTRVTNIKSAIATSAVDKNAARIDAIAGDKLTLSLFDTATPTAISTAEAVYIDVVGEGVSNMVVLDFGTDDIAQSLEVGEDTGVTSLKLDLNIAAAGALTKVVTEELTEL